MAAWVKYGMRLDIALAVVMEVAVLELHTAETEAERAAAVAFNNRLWQVAQGLAPQAPLAEDGVALRNTAALVLAGGRRVDQLVELNRCFARLLAGRAATDGALGQILDRWRAARRDGTDLEFGPWLLEMLSGFVGGGTQALAA